MFDRLETQYLNKLVESKVRDFSTPKPFHAVKVQRLGGDKAKPSAQVSSKLPLPISALVSNFTVKSREIMDRTPVVARILGFTRKAFVEVSEFLQGLFQELWVLYLLTRVQREKSVFHTEVCTYTFTRSRQNFFRGVICHDIKPIRSDTVAKDLDIADVSMPRAVLVKKKPTLVELQTLRGFVPRFERQADTSIFEFIACLELRRTVFVTFLVFRATNTSNVEKTFPSDVQADNHSVKCVTRYPCPMLFCPMEQLRQVRLQEIPSGILAVPPIASIFQLQEVVMDIRKVVKHIAQALVLGVVTYLIFVRSHWTIAYSVLNPYPVGGRHVASQQRLVCLPTQCKYFNILILFVKKKEGRCFLP